MKTLIIIAVIIFTGSKVGLYATDKIMDNTNDLSIIEDHKKALDDVK